MLPTNLIQFKISYLSVVWYEHISSARSSLPIEASVKLDKKYITNRTAINICFW